MNPRHAGCHRAFAVAARAVAAWGASVAKRWARRAIAARAARIVAGLERTAFGVARGAVATRRCRDRQTTDAGHGRQPDARGASPRGVNGRRSLSPLGRSPRGTPRSPNDGRGPRSPAEERDSSPRGLNGRRSLSPLGRSPRGAPRSPNAGRGPRSPAEERDSSPRGLNGRRSLSPLGRSPRGAPRSPNAGRGPRSPARKNAEHRHAA